MGVAKLRCEPLTPERWNDLAKLFGPRGACAGCWCMYPRRTSAEGRFSGEANRRAFHRRVRSGPPPGLLAYRGGEPVGWVAIAPRSEYRRLERSRILRPVDDREVWSVPCLFVASGHRRSGVTKTLLAAACEWAAKRGARLVEGYPVDTGGKPYAPAFAFHGLLGTFASAGFHEVARRSPTRPIMRRALGRKRAKHG